MTTTSKGALGDMANTPAAPSRRRFVSGLVTGAACAAYLPLLSKPAWAQKGVVKFGCSLPLSGPYEQVSKLYRFGYEFWAETVGNKIRVGDHEMAVEWVFYDDEFNPARAAQLTERLITTDKVDCIVGTYGTDSVLAQGAIAARYNKITIQAGAASGRIDEEIGGRATFTVVASASVYPRLAMEFFGTLEPKPKRIATISYDEAANKEMALAVKEMAPGLGMEHVLDIELPVNVRDLRPTILKLKRAGQIDILYHTGHDVPLISLIQEAAALDFNPNAIMGGYLTTVPNVKKTLQDKMQDMYGIAMWLPQLKYHDQHFASCQEFSDKHQQSKGVPATYHSAMSYTIPVLYELALQDAPKENPFDNAVIRKKLLAMDGVPTIWGPIRFNDKGRIASSGLPVIQWQGKDPALQVVYPANLSTAKPIYPVPAWSKRS